MATLFLEVGLEDIKKVVNEHKHSLFEILK